MAEVGVDRAMDPLMDLYATIDSMAASWSSLMKIADHAREVRDQLAANGDERSAMVAHHENAALSFHLRDGQLSDLFGWTMEDGSHKAWPCIEEIDDQTASYYARRADQVTHPALIARYAHILWLHPHTKHRRYATRAIDVYLEGASSALLRSESSDSRDWRIDAEQGIVAALTLAWQVGHRVSDAEDICMRAIVPDRSSKALAHLRLNLVSFVAEVKARGAKGLLSRVYSVVRNEVESSRPDTDAFAILDLAGAGLRLAERLGQDIKWWHRKLGDGKQSLADFASGDSLVGLTWLQDAARHYNAAGESELEREALDEYDRRVPGAKFARIESEIDMSEVYRSFDKIAEQLAADGPEAVIGFLATAGPPLIPDVNVVQESAQQLSERSPLLSLVTHQVLDEDGRPIGTLSGPEAGRQHWFNFEYSQRVQANTLELTKRVMFRAIKTQSFDASQLDAYLRTVSWLGAEIDGPEGDDDRPMRFRWTELLLPSIDEYVRLLTEYWEEEAEIPRFVLAVDSLVPKVEGMIRCLLNLVGRGTSRSRTRGDQYSIDEMSLDAMLGLDELEKLMGPNDVQFLRFVLSDKVGWNLRNRSSHGRMIPQEYTVHHFHLVLLCVLRLSRFQITDASDNGRRPQENPDAK